MKVSDKIILHSNVIFIIQDQFDPFYGFRYKEIDSSSNKHNNYLKVLETN